MDAGLADLALAFLPGEQGSDGPSKYLLRHAALNGEARPRTGATPQTTTLGRRLTARCATDPHLVHD